ncbi:membrane peptidoglycan carboxypeptidase [Jatrophihabitans sp. GAS493]|uniref:transglycosylase domain-containing protein n=1 Tax=Jatrophihabitans sp. GAS493 TaxID=1907575 RepID=UPI000BBFFAEE|nr:transglycosylase domain-containing protein [Jatrophihabitans sp. GAS493]SOD71884.1 membrane peptidoglycan carboxypeptidase [Jatrophihabitans sp. GAS493]
MVAGVLVAGSILPVVGGIGLAAKTQTDKFLTTSCDLQETAPPQKTTLYANDGKTVIATLFTQDRQPVPLSQVPNYLVQALVATEDRRFYSHTGVDMRGLLRSAFSTGSGDTQGGSTLTMQYVKQVRYYQAVTTPSSTEAEKEAAAKLQAAAISQNIDRKIEDANCALYLENVKHESKDTILDNYLNIAFFGENSYGIESAAQNFFGKDVSKLTLPESAVLVGALQAPSDYDPYLHPVASKQRRNVVIQNLVEVGKLSQAEADKYKAQPLTLTNSSPPVVRSDCTSAVVANAGFFCAYVTNWLKANKTVTDHTLYTSGLKIITTMDAKLQTTVQTSLSKAMSTKARSTAILPVVDPKTGNVLAMATNKQYGVAPNQSENLLFTDASAAGASTYKYFTALAALKAGVSPSFILSAPSPYKPTSCGGDKAISNDSTSIPTTTTMKDAFARSSNTYFVGMEDKFFYQCDLTPVVQTAVQMGLTSLNDLTDPNNPKSQTVAEKYIATQQYSFTIGSPATSPLELASAYAASANDGTYCPPAPVLSVTNADGNSLPVKRAACAQVIDPQVAREMVQIMNAESVGVGTAAPAFHDYYNDGGSTVAGKTGTQAADGKNSKQNSAVWYVGTTPNLAASMAIFDPNAPSNPVLDVPGAANGQATGTTAATLWMKALGSTLKQSTWDWQSPQVMANGVSVPNVVGESQAVATAKLAAAGFKLKEYSAGYTEADGSPYTGLTCASNAGPGDVGYQSPSGIAPAGATVSVCLSSGVRAYVPTPRPQPAATPKPGAATPKPGAATPKPGAPTPKPNPTPKPGHAPGAPAH